MKKLKSFIDNLAIDKKSHIVFGVIVNPIIILTFIFLGYILNINLLLFGVLGCLASYFFHLSIEFWQKRINSGKFELLDSLAGSSSSILIKIILLTLYFLQ